MICPTQFERFFFNVKSGSCETFVFGGCEENENNFKTRADCVAACSPVMPKARIGLSIEEESDRREGKGRHCCLRDVLECRRTSHLAARMI